MTEFSPYHAYPAGPEPVSPSGPPPVLVSVADPVPQRRATVAFRLILVIPHIIALWALSIAATVVLVLGWFGALFTGRLPEFAGSYIAGYLRWTVRVHGYLFLLTDVYPPFTLDDDPAYPVRVGVPPAQPLNRAAVFFRNILGIPANIIAIVLIYGAGTLMSFIAWLVTLVAGRLPDSFHLAFTAVLRYFTRLAGYLWLLTPAYPGGLYGDQPGTVTWADQLPAAGTAGGWGTPPSGYGNPGYGAPGDVQPAGYGSQPVARPASWLLLLTSGARRLVTVFIVLGAVLLAGWAVLGAVSGSSSNTATAATAIPKLDTAFSTLADNLETVQTAEKACAGELTCVTSLDAKAAGYFHDFGRQLAATSLPASALPAAATLTLATSSLTQDFTELGQATSTDQYLSTVEDSNLQQTITDFDTDFRTLRQELSR